MTNSLNIGFLNKIHTHLTHITFTEAADSYFGSGSCAAEAKINNTFVTVVFFYDIRDFMLDFGCLKRQNCSHAACLQMCSGAVTCSSASVCLLSTLS